jgi:hypothetical protein
MYLEFSEKCSILSGEFLFELGGQAFNFIGLHIPVLQEANCILAEHAILWEPRGAVRSASGVVRSPGTNHTSVISLLHKTDTSELSSTILTQREIQTLSSLLYAETNFK